MSPLVASRLVHRCRCSRRLRAARNSAIQQTPASREVWEWIALLPPGAVQVLRIPARIAKCTMPLLACQQVA